MTQIFVGNLTYTVSETDLTRAFEQYGRVSSVRIMTEAASGPQADAMLNRKGSSPPAGSGLIGGTYKEGTIIFSISIKSDDQAKLAALVAEVRRGLK